MRKRPGRPGRFSFPRHSGMRLLAQARNPYSRSWLWIPGSRYRAPRNGGLPIASVDRRHRQSCQFDAVDAADVERHHLGAVRLAATREHVDAALDAELMPDRMLVEQIFL